MKRPTDGAPHYTIYKVTENTELLPFVMQKMNGISRSKAKSILSGNGVKVDNRTESHFDFLLRPGMQVEVSKRKRHDEQTNQFFHIIYEDNWIIVIDKAPNVLSMAVGKNDINLKSLLDFYFAESKQLCTAHVVHRLDRDTSGVMIYAKSSKVQQILENNWKELIIDRRYIAVVCGQMEHKDGRVENWLKDTKQFVTFSSNVDNGGKYAVTDYHTISVGKAYSLVELQLQTGRKNQIRVHLQDINHPVVGDHKYGCTEDPIGRLGLHAFRLHFFHPVTHEAMSFETPYPENFIQLLKSSTIKQGFIDK
jgi:23S rRNA pseudouridine1911/1915/1917 synthase